MEKENEDFYLIDKDCASYYPSIILTLNLYPKHLGENFLNVYRSIVERRLRAKKAKDKIVADSLKITINGSFGKLGSKYSSLYSPDLLIQVTITGQLALLMLIEMIENQGIPVVSANTDGIVIKCPKSKYDLLEQITRQWEKETNFETEETRYKALYSKDVNNYIAVKLDGSCKTKGAYSKPGLQKNPTNTICIEAATALIVGNTPVETTIRDCKDVTKFVTCRTVRGGAEKNGIYLGKLVRFYYAKGEQGTINYVVNGHVVPKSDGAKPLMDLEGFPDDINYDWYVEETNKILTEIAYYKTEKQHKFF